MSKKDFNDLINFIPDKEAKTDDFSKKLGYEWPLIRDYRGGVDSFTNEILDNARTIRRRAARGVIYTETPATQEVLPNNITSNTLSARVNSALFDISDVDNLINSVTESPQDTILRSSGRVGPTRIVREPLVTRELPTSTLTEADVRQFMDLLRNPTPNEF